VPVIEKIVDGVEYTITEQFAVTRLEVRQFYCWGRSLFHLFRLCLWDDPCHNTVAFAELDGLASVDLGSDLSGVNELVYGQGKNIHILSHKSRSPIFPLPSLVL
jgi:hypothetical protein